MKPTAATDSPDAPATIAVLCSFPGCSKRAYGGLCHGHATQRRRGKALAPLLQVRALVPNPDLPGTVLVPLTKGYFAIIDEGDAEAVGKHNWQSKTEQRRLTRYAVRGQHIPGVPSRTVTIYLHVFLWTAWGLPVASELDHENGNGLDCRRQNIRPATHEENMRNRKIPRNNTSGLKGVYREGKKWRAQIGSGRERRYLGVFSQREEAAAAYDSAVRDLHGEFARPNRGAQ